MKEYNRENAVKYARKYALMRNPLFFTFEGIGGNCTNFVSQCILAGSCVMNFTPTFGW
ncbi:MAG: amidase domain-containing protein, partial [Clostridia bacterium]|nr:amidase domain-containing protein [Clostridia bacterium]